jgi:tape measure domain-containing protein
MANDARLEIVLAAKDMSQQAFNKVQERLAGLKRTMTSVQGLLATAGIGYGLGGLAKSVVGVADSFEQMQMKLEQLNSGRGKQILDELNQWAKRMPVDTREAVNTFIQMQAYGLQPTIEKMTTLVDVATVMGQEALPRVSRALGQMQAKGKVSAEEMLQLTEVGINANKYLVSAFGKTVEELQKTKVPIEQVIDAIWKGLAGEYGGAAAKASNTWRGMMEALESEFVDLSKTIMDAGLFDGLKSGLREVTELTSEWATQNKGLIAVKVPEYIKTTSETISGLIGLYQSLPDDVIGSAGAGIAGRIIFGSWRAGAMVAAINELNEGLRVYGMNIGAIADRYRDAAKASQNILDVITGKRDWNTGILKGAYDRRDPKDEIQGSELFMQRAAGGYDDPVVRYSREFTQRRREAIRKAQEAAAEAAKEVKKLAEEVKKYQDEFALALMGGSRLDEYMLGGNPDNVIGRMETERLARIREEAKQVYGAAGSDGDYITRHREEIGPYDADRVKKTMEEIRAQSEESMGGLVELSARTAEAMQDNFSDLFFDAFTGKLKSLEDYAEAVFTSIQRMLADIAAQMATQAIFGGGSVGGTAGGGGLMGALGSLAGLFGGSAGGGSSAVMSSTTALALVKHAGGVVDGTGPARRIPAWMLSGAPRLHNGLAPDEYPAILQRGERVVSKSQAQMPAANITINVAAPQGRLDRESIAGLQTALYTTINRAGRRNA